MAPRAADRARRAEAWRLVDVMLDVALPLAVQAFNHPQVWLLPMGTLGSYAATFAGHKTKRLDEARKILIKNVEHMHYSVYCQAHAVWTKRKTNGVDGLNGIPPLADCDPESWTWARLHTTFQFAIRATGPFTASAVRGLNAAKCMAMCLLVLRREKTKADEGAWLQHLPPHYYHVLLPRPRPVPIDVEKMIVSISAEVDRAKGEGHDILNAWTPETWQRFIDGMVESGIYRGDENRTPTASVLGEEGLTL